MPIERKRNPKPPPGPGGRPVGTKGTGPKQPKATGPLTLAEIKFAELYVQGSLNHQECAKQAGIATASQSGTATRIRRLLRDPRVYTLIDRFRRDAATAARISIETLASDYVKRVCADRSKIFHPESGKILPMSQWPEVLRQMVRSIRHCPKTGVITHFSFVETNHIDHILAYWVGMIGERQPNASAAPLTRIIVENVVGCVNDLPLPTAESIPEREYLLDD